MSTKVMGDVFLKGAKHGTTIHTTTNFIHKLKTTHHINTTLITKHNNNKHANNRIAVTTYKQPQTTSTSNLLAPTIATHAYSRNSEASFVSFSARAKQTNPAQSHRNGAALMTIPRFV
ncbi:hypothetical protein E2C01_006422 [Portunus trituberculatus]|uniref:Uncharacterized protein n=1 Tax=Portunus trituberculatus TaxID=210409 RepID=A0A5B7CWU3_PORTR|nr:hypothetical protein [Portunus trituberculatus]